MAKKLSKALSELARVPSQISRSVSARYNQEIQKGFDQGHDPYGKKWANLRPATLAKGRRPPPLTATGRGRRGVKAKPMQGAGIALTSTVSYMKYHRTGTSKMARRDFLPDEEKGLPKKWTDIWEEEFETQARKIFNRRLKV